MRRLSATSRRWLHWQLFYLAGGMGVYIMLYSLRVPSMIAGCIGGTFLCGNLMTASMNALSFVYAKRPFPLNWLTFSATLLLLSVVCVTITIYVVGWLILPAAVVHWKYFAPFWEFSFIATVISGLLSYAYVQSKGRLERRNVELEQALKSGEARLESQDQELQRAREIQESLLPRNILQIDGFEIAAAWQPARTVGGDYYDVLKLSDDTLGICIADVVGKGVSAALLMANIQAAVRAFASETASPAWLCSRINNVLCGNIADDKFVTFFFGLLDGRTGTLTYCNAGHLPPILLRGSSNTLRLDEGGLVLGVSTKAQYTEASIHLAPEDRLLLFTDGITEAASVDDEEYGDHRIEIMAAQGAGDRAAEIIARIMNDTAVFCQSHFNDDATMLVLTALAPAITQR